MDDPIPAPTPSPDDSAEPSAPAMEETSVALPEDRCSPMTDGVQRYDFNHPSFLASNELRQLKMKHEDFLLKLAARLSIYLRLEFGVSIASLETLTYKKFVERLPYPAHLTLFKVEPLRGICILNLSPKLGLSIVDRLMGGPGSCQAELNRDLTEIEIALLDQTEQIILGEWCTHWSQAQTLKPQILGHENNGHFLQTSAPETIMVSLTLQVRMGEGDETMQIVFPYPTLEPLIRQLETGPSKQEPPKAEAPRKWNPQLSDAKIPLTAEWPVIQMTMGDLAKLKVGDVLPLDPDLMDHVQLKLGNVPKFVARLGNVGDKWAIEIRETIKP